MMLTGVTGVSTRASNVVEYRLPKSTMHRKKKGFVSCAV